MRLAFAILALSAIAIAQPIPQGFVPGQQTVFRDPSPPSGFFTSNDNYHSLQVNQGDFPTAAYIHTANHSEAIFGTTRIASGLGLGSVVAVGGEFEAIHESDGSAAFGIAIVALSGNTQSQTFGINATMIDGNRKAATDPGFVSHPCRFCVVQENDLVITSTDSKNAWAYSAEVSPSSVAMAGNGTVPRQYGFFADNAADQIASSATFVGAGLDDFSIPAVASSTWNSNQVYCVKVQSTGAPDLISFTPFAGAACLTGIDLAASTATHITSATHWPALYDGPAIGFTNGDVGQVAEIVGGTGWTTGKRVITGAGSGIASVDTSVCASPPCTGGTFVIWEATTNTATETDLVIDGVTATIVSSAAHPFVAADVDQPINLTAGTGFTTGWARVLSVAAGKATLSRSAGTLGSTGGSYTLNTILTPMTACASSNTWFTLPEDDTLSPYLQNQPIRPAVTSLGAAGCWTATTGHTAGTYWHFGVTGVPNWYVAFNSSKGAANIWANIPPLYGGPGSQSQPINWFSTTPNATSDSNLQEQWLLTAAGTFVQRNRVNGGAFNAAYTRDVSGNVTVNALNATGLVVGVGRAPTTLAGSGNLAVPGILNGIYNVTNSGAQAVQFTAATNVTSNMPGGCQVGNTIWVSIRAPSANTGIVTISAGTGNTLDTTWEAVPWTLAPLGNHWILAQGLITSCTTPAVTYSILGSG